MVFVIIVINVVLKQYRDVEHEGIRYSYEYCSYKSVDKRSLKRHKEVEHEGIRYTCEYCSYKSVEKRNLQKLVQFMHKGACYICNQCDIKARTEETHIEKVHMKKT